MAIVLHGLSIQKSFKTPEALRKIFAFVAAVFLLLYPDVTFAGTSDPTYDKMSLKQKVGQVFIWTYAGTDFTPQMERWLSNYQPGALITFRRNIKSATQVARMNQRIQSLASRKMLAPPFLMIDQEGGTVTRLRTSVPLPSALALGKMDDNEFVKSFAKTKADVLVAVGFNVNLAPVLDISNPNKESFIGNRAFGDDPETVSKIANAYAEGISSGGMLPTAKHYPGHGGLAQDSHHTTPKKMSTYQELSEKDLIPFAAYAHAEFPRAIMMAHVSLPAIDATGVPSTYSKVLIQEYLREKLSYNGLIITDDLEMDGATIEKDIGARTIRAFLAGNDMVMLAGSPSNQKKAFDAMVAAVNDGRISEERLKESVQRILAYKRDLKLGPFTFNSKKAKLAFNELKTKSRDVLRKNFSLSLSGKTANWPEVQPETRVIVFSADSQFFTSFKSTFRGQAKHFLLTPQSLEQAALELKNDRHTLAVVYASGSQTARWLTQLSSEAKAKAIVINANHPGEIEVQSEFMTVLNINSRDSESGSALAEALGAPTPRTPATSEVSSEEPEEKPQ